VAGTNANSASAIYSASKAGVISLTKTAAQEFAGSGVRVNAVCPGLIETSMTQPIFDYARKSGKQARLGSLNPCRRAGQAEEIADAVYFLAGADASYINGHVLVVDGGLSSSLPYAPQSALIREQPD
jgi:NAD(P)-dependent dehydrogenase (short-subunit alcohol dehydrogenase family)